MERFGRTASAILHMGKRQLSIQAYFRDPFKKLLPYPPKERVKLMEKIRREKYRRAVSKWPDRNYQRIGSTKAPGGISAAIYAKDLGIILKMREVTSISIEAIAGIKKRPYQKPARILFCVHARFICQIEGHRSGNQTHEDRYMLVMARDGSDAKRRLRKEFKIYEQPYLNSYGELVRWKFRKIVEIQEAADYEFNPEGTEVYYVYAGKRIRREYEWHPKYFKHREKIVL